jgi:hypothetical protein
LVSKVKKLLDLFPSSKAYQAFEHFANILKNQNNKMTVHHVSEFATLQAKERVYNKANFYWYVITPLLELGFLDKIPTWNNDLKRTQYCYVPVFNDLPRHPVGRGYYRDAWYLCKEWNDLFFGEESSLRNVNQFKERPQTMSSQSTKGEIRLNGSREIVVE